MARTADLVLMMLDASKQDVQRELLEKELESVGIRLNKPKPNIYFKVSILSCIESEQHSLNHSHIFIFVLILVLEFHF